MALISVSKLIQIQIEVQIHIFCLQAEVLERSEMQMREISARLVESERRSQAWEAREVGQGAQLAYAAQVGGLLFRH